MNKAFIFDMDGVIVDSERFWVPTEEPFLKKLFGEKILGEMIPLVGLGLDGIYDKATALGAIVDKDEYLRGYEEVAMRVYDVSPITEGVDRLIDRLTELDFKLGIVTQSPQTWINRVFPRLFSKDKFDIVVSVKDRGLKQKPHPDGYSEAFKILEADAAKSIVLEDANPGIASGKASGAYVIGYRGNLIDGYEQSGADIYADTMDEVIRLVESFDRN